jgi:flagellar motility protein MotE (MotC chaperone)
MKPMIKRKPKQAKPAEVRLLPAVIGVGAILFVVKAAGLAFSANAATTEPAAKPAQTAPAKPGAPAPANASPAKPADPLAAINAALPVPAKSAKPAGEPRTSDQLSEDLAGSGISSAEMDVLTSLADRRDALEQRQRDLDLRANIIQATEKRIDGKIAELKALQAKIEALIGQRDAKELEQLDGLVKVYTAMKPKDAARIFASLDDNVRLGVAGRMKPDVVAGIMSALPAEVAQKLSVELANRFKVPADAGVPAAKATPAGPPAPGG